MRQAELFGEAQRLSLAPIIEIASIMLLQILTPCPGAGAAAMHDLLAYLFQDGRGLPRTICRRRRT